jgi:hypothetical protein
MPDIDLTDLLSDPDFAEQLTITRNQQVMGSNGRLTVTTIAISPAPYGVVIPQADLPIQRGPGQQTLPRLIQVHTVFRLRSASTDADTPYEPDVITWNGDSYVVNKVSDFSHFGAGFIQADCSAEGAVQQAPV